MAIALGNLYHNDCQVEETDLAQVLLAADYISFMDLVYACSDRMKKCINYSNVTNFYNSAIKVIGS